MFKKLTLYSTAQCNFCDEQDLINKEEASIKYLKTKVKLTEPFRGMSGEYNQTFICIDCIRKAINLLKQEGVFK